MNDAVGQMDKITQSNASNAEEVASTAEELSAQSASLTEQVDALNLLVRGVRGQTEPVSAAPRPAATKPARTPRPSAQAAPAHFIDAG